MIDGALSFNNIYKTPKQAEKLTIENSVLAPPTITASFEATNSAQVTIHGFASSNSKVNIYFDDALVDTVNSLPDGSFFTKELRLNPGTNNIFGRTVDDQGKESLASKTYQLLFTDKKPDLTLLDPKPDATTAQEDQGRLFIKAKTATPDVKAYINDVQQIITSNNEFQTFIPLHEGENTFTVKVVDKASNTNEVARTLTYTKK